MATTTGIGLRNVQVAIRDTDGTIQIQGSPAAGTAYAGEQISGALALTITIPEPQRITARGDDVPYHTFNLPPTENPSGELRVSKTNMDALALITSTNEFGSAGARRFGLGTDKQGEEDALFMWGCRQGIDSDEDSATFGQRRWETYILPNALASVRPATMEDSTVGEFTFSIVANQATVDQYGASFALGTHGFTKTAMLIVVTKYKFWIDAFEGDGAEDEFTLTYGAFLQADSVLNVYVDGAPAAYTQAGGIVTLTAGAPALATKVIIEYDYQD